MKKTFITCLALCTCFLVYAQSGIPDSSFGNNGQVVTDFGSTEAIAAIALQADGKIVAGGSYDEYPAANTRLNSCAVARYQSNGGLDSSFGVNGFVHNKIGKSFSEIQAVAVLPNGKIIAAGYANLGGYYNQLIVIRYTKGGIIDSSFGTSGIAYYVAGKTESAIGNAIAIQADGKIIVAGSIQPSLGTPAAIIAIRLKSDGERDSSFGINGNARLTIGKNSSANAIALLPNGKIIIAGAGTGFDTSSTQFAAIRLTISGTPDPAFGNNGRVVSTLGAYSAAKAIAINSAGKIVLAGYARKGQQINIALLRYNINGSLDSSFGEAGITISKFADQASANGVVIQTDGKVVIAGGAGDSLSTLNNHLVLARYSSRGKLDKDFGTGGKIIISFNNDAKSGGSAALLQPDGKIIAAGYTSADTEGNNSDFALVRYLPDQKPKIEQPIMPIAKVVFYSRSSLVIKTAP